MERVFKKICRAYHLGELQGYEELPGGTDARTWKLTARGYYLVRTLRDKEQGERELALCVHLIKHDFYDMAVVYDTEDGQPAVEVGGTWYQVQEFCPGHMPAAGRQGVAARMGKLVKRLADHMPEGMIHGDLGPWNMVVQEGGTIRIIDFGSAREGDPYFDFATAFAGIVNHTTDRTRMTACREFLAELDADRERLLAQLRLWAEEGVRRWQDTDGTMTKRFYHALKWAEEHIHEL